MIRWLGGLIGGALAIGAIVLLAGVPSIVAPVVTAPVAEDPVPTVTPTPEPEPVAAAPSPIEALASAPTADPAEPVQDEPEPVAAPPEPIAAPPAPVDTVEALRWHAFWSPFRSQIAANGFVSQLQTVTGLDYRVVTVKPGVYEVAFGYHDDDEITENLAQIAAATGLDVPGS